MALSAPIPVLKFRAKKRAREQGISHYKALDRIAEQEGFQTWSHLVACAPAPTEKRDVITSLPLLPAERAEFVKAANRVFEAVFERVEPNNPGETRALWNAADYVDNHLLGEGMLPIGYNYALSLVDAFLVHHVIDLAVQADKQVA